MTTTAAGQDGAVFTEGRGRRARLAHECLRSARQPLTHPRKKPCREEGCQNPDGSPAACFVLAEEVFCIICSLEFLSVYLQGQLGEGQRCEVPVSYINRANIINGKYILQ